MNKQDRQALMKEMILGQSIKRQDDLVEAMAKAGASVTQATISRDIKELGFVKRADQTGYYYDLPPEDKALEATDVHYPGLLSVRQQGLFLSLGTAPGSAQLLKQRLIEQAIPGLFSLLADDDTVLVLMETPEALTQLYQDLGGAHASRNRH